MVCWRRSASRTNVVWRFGLNTLTLAVILPFAGAVAVLITGSRPNLRECASPGTGITLVGLVASLLPAVLAGRRPAIVLVSPCRFSST